MKRRKKQRILAAGTAVCMLLSLSGCAGSTQPDADKGGETGTSATGGTYYLSLIHISLILATDPRSVFFCPGEM